MSLGVDFESVLMDAVEKANTLYRNGSYSEALRLYVAEAINNNPSCQCQIGFMYYQGKGTPCDLCAAEKWFKQALEQGYEQASVGLFRVYVEGKQFEKALPYMRRMARKKYPPALYWLGRMYYKGCGVLKNSDKAFIYFTLAAQHTHFPSMRDRSKLMLRGEKGFFARFLVRMNLLKLH